MARRGGASRVESVGRHGQPQVGHLPQVIAGNASVQVLGRHLLGHAHVEDDDGFDQLVVRRVVLSGSRQLEKLGCDSGAIGRALHRGVPHGRGKSRTRHEKPHSRG